MTYISYDELGNYLETSKRQIVLKRNGMALFPLWFAEEQVARQMIVRINELYGPEIDYLGWVEWLSDIRQIHQAERERFRFGDFVGELIALNKPITAEDYQRCWENINE